MLFQFEYSGFTLKTVEAIALVRQNLGSKTAANLGGGGVGRPVSGIRPPADSKGPPFGTF